MNPRSIASLLADEPWAIQPERLEGMLSVQWANLPPLAELQAALTGAPQPARRRGDTVAVIPIRGTIRQHPSGDLFELLFGGGGSTVDALTAQFREAMADPSVRGLVLDVDSPGGSAYGISELATEIYRARGEKPIVAFANSVSASAAYWLASAADRIIATPSALVGSIGVYTVHMDFSGALEQAGITPTILSAGKYKAEGNEFEPLGDEAQKAGQQLVDDYYGMFVRDVARNRSTTEAQVRNGYGEGRALTARRALDAKLIDRIGTADAAFNEAGNTATARRGAVAPVDDGAGDGADDEAAARAPRQTFADHAAGALAALEAFADRARSLADLRAEDGRRLGEAAREAVARVATDAEAVVQTMQTILEAHAEPDPAADERRERFRSEGWLLRHSALEASLELLKASA